MKPAVPSTPEALEQRALSVVATMDDVIKLRSVMANAKGRSTAVERAAFLRIIAVSAVPGEPVEQDAWAMVHTIEELRRREHGRAKPMGKLRPRIARDGIVPALEYVALNQSEGFDEVVAYDMPEMAAESIVLKYRDQFSEAAVAAAKARLEGAGVAIPG